LYSTAALEDDEMGKEPLKEALWVFSSHSGRNWPKDVAATGRTHVND
jgi:hypothetical protein